MSIVVPTPLLRPRSPLSLLKRLLMAQAESQVCPVSDVRFAVHFAVRALHITV